MRFPVSTPPSCIDDTLPFQFGAADGNPYNIKSDFWGPIELGGNLYCLVGTLPTARGGGKFLSCYRSVDEGASWSLYGQSPSKFSKISLWLEESTGIATIAHADVASGEVALTIVDYDIVTNTFSTTATGAPIIVSFKHAWQVIKRLNGKLVLIYTADNTLNTNIANLQWAEWDGASWSTGLIRSVANPIGADIYCVTVSRDSQDRIHMMYSPNTTTHWTYNALNVDNTLIGETDLSTTVIAYVGHNFQHGNVWAGSDGKVRICWSLADPAVNSFATKVVVATSDSLTPTAWTLDTLFTSDASTVGQAEFAIGRDISGNQIVIIPVQWTPTSAHFAPSLYVSIFSSNSWSPAQLLWDGGLFPPISQFINGDRDNALEWIAEAEPFRLFSSISLSKRGVVAALWEGDLQSQGLIFYFNCDFLVNKPVTKLLQVSSTDIRRQITSPLKKRIVQYTTGGSGATGGTKGKGGSSSGGGGGSFACPYKFVPIQTLGTPPYAPWTGHVVAVIDLNDNGWAHVQIDNETVLNTPGRPYGYMSSSNPALSGFFFVEIFVNGIELYLYRIVLDGCNNTIPGSPVFTATVGDVLTEYITTLAP